jgi:hypothetical protein
LCKTRLAALIELSNAKSVDLTPENITLLQQMLDIAVDGQEDCPVRPNLNMRIMTTGVYGCCWLWFGKDYNL